MKELTEGQERKIKAFKLRREGMIYKDIGLALGGVSSARAQQLVQHGERLNEAVNIGQLIYKKTP